MRPEFKENVEGYSKLAKELSDKNLSKKNKPAVEARLGERIGAAAETRQSDAGSQREIFDLQKEKQVIMRRLEQKIAHLDDPKHEWRALQGERPARKEGDAYIVQAKSGEELPVTKGELLTDMRWGYRYFLDPQTVDRNVRKRYLIEDAKHRLSQLLDRQITIDETSSADTDWMKQKAYQNREADIVSEKTGHLAERMVQNFMTKLTIDHDADFTVRPTDAFADVEEKIDFIVERRDLERGVQVTADSHAKHVGVQFTTNTSEVARRKKQAQLRHSLQHFEEIREKGTEGVEIDDLVLVTMPSDEIRAAYDQWIQDPKPGGPEKLLDDQTRQEVFSGVMKDILSPEEIDEQWSKVANAPETLQAESKA